VRDPSPRQWLTGLQRLRRGRRLRLPSAGVRTAALLVLPWRRLRPVAQLNRWLVRWQLARALRRLAIEQPVLWLRLPTPELVDQLNALPVRAVVYECIDDYSAYPHYRAAERSWLRSCEQRLVASADAVVALSERVAARFPEAAARTRVLPLGADLADSRRATGPSAELADLPRPRLGLVGGLDERVDFDLLRRLSLAVPTWSVILIGPALDGAGVRRVADLPNVHLLGPRAHELVPSYLAALDVCLLPYRRTPWTDGCFPAKLPEYLASGRPIVATDLPALAGYHEVVEITRTAAAFVDACRRLATDGDPVGARRRQAVAAAYSLGTRCQAIDDLLAVL
jgi:glycosyltransferase involved in cell wall biosynthesis